ncbi:MAG TPA: MarR family transcriptional regulator [Polyangiaceae bacterium]|nr:MarR family transcriptional regulator [Polyangiaceae bacterium]
MTRLTTTNYRRLAAFRYEMRKFLSFSEQAARDAGVEPQQHQLMLALRGLPDGARPTIGAVAERLCVQHHTAVGLVDKLEARALLTRERGADDRRQVLLKLTADGEELLQRLSTLHRQQLLVVGPAMVTALSAIVTEAGQVKPKARTPKPSKRPTPRSDG